MPIELNDTNVQWISNHPIMNKKIKELIKDNQNQNQNQNRTHNQTHNHNIYTDRRIDSIDSNLKYRIDSLERNVNTELKAINKSISHENMSTYVSNIIRDELSRKMLRSEQYQHIFQQNIEKLKSELKSTGYSIIDSIINDDSHKTVADKHLNNLSMILENKYSNFIVNTNEKIDKKVKEISRYDDKISNLETEINNYKSKYHSLEFTYYLTLFLFGGILLIYGLNKLFSYGDANYVMNSGVKPIESMGSPVLTFT